MQLRKTRKIKINNMAKKYSSSTKGQGAIIIIAALVALVIFIVKIILVLLPFIVAVFLGYKYFQWQNTRLLVYDNNWHRFYHEELKFKIHLWASILTVASGLIIAFFRPWAGIPISLVGILTFPKIQQILTQKLNGRYNNWTKGTVIASLLTVSIAANCVYSAALEKIKTEQAKIEKAKTDELERINKENQIRIDSTNYFVKLASNNIKDKKYNSAEVYLQRATNLDPENQDIAY
jgi:hypothetical protein